MVRTSKTTPPGRWIRGAVKLLSSAVDWYATLAGSESPLQRGLSLVLLAVMAFAGILGLLHVLDPYPLKDWIYLKITLDLMGMRGMLTYLLMTGILPLISPLSLIIVTGAAAFGPVKGFILSYLGCLLNANIAYILVKSLSIDQRWGKTEKTRRVQDAIRRHGYPIVLGLQLISVIPFTLINAAAAGAGISWKKFMKATCLGLLPCLLVYSIMGEQLITDMVSPRVYFAGVLVAVLLLLVMAMRRKRISRQQKVTQ